MIAGVLEIQMLAQLGRISDDMGKAKKIVSDAVGDIQGILGTIGVGLSLGGFVALVRSAAESGDAAAKMGDRFGVATETIIAMEHAVKIAGGSSEGLAMSMRTLARTSIEAAQGNTQLWMGFQRLGISAQEFIKLPMDQQLSTVIDRLHSMANASERNVLAQQLMGRQAGEMAGLIAEGSQAFIKAKEDTEAWGLAINRVDAAKLEIMNDELKRVQDSTKGVATQIALALSPVVAALAKQFADTKAEARGYRDEIATGSDYIAEAIGYTANVLRGLQYSWMVLKSTVGLVTGGILEAIGQIVIALADNPMTRWAATLPGAMGEAAREVTINAKAIGENFVSLAHGFYNTADAVIDELNALIAEGLPHDKVVKWIADAKDQMDKASAEMAAHRQSTGGGTPGIIPFDQYTAALAQQLGAVIDHNKTALQLAEEKAMKEQAILDESAEKGLITQEYWEGQTVLLAARTAQEKQKLMFQEWETNRQKNQAVTNMEMNTWRLGAEFLQVFAGKSKAAAIAVIAINKALAIAQTIQATSVAVMRAFADLGPIAGAPVAAEMRALGAIQVALIAATGIGQALQVGSGGASPGSPSNPVSTVPGIGSTPGPIQSSPVNSPVEIHVTIENNAPIVGVDGARQLVNDIVIPALQDAIGRDDVVIIAPNSRQAAELRPAT